MKKLFMLFAATAMLFSSCDSEADTTVTDPDVDVNGGDDDDDDVTTTNPDEDLEYDLLIDVSAESISIDKGETATFTVTYFGEDVTDEALIVDVTSGGYEIMDGNEFSTLRPGIHTFFAMHDNHSSEKISILATSESNVSNTFYRRNLVTKFTATWCTYCPAMTTAIEMAKRLYPDRLCEMAIHSSDELSIDSYYSSYSSAMNVVGLPTVGIDMDKDFSTTVKSSTWIASSAEQSMKNNPTVVGIKADVTLDGTVLNIDIESTYVADGTYKIVVALLQSGFNYSQTGTDDTSYTQDHVLRGFFQASPLGDMLGDLIAGERVENHYELDLETTLDQDTIDRTEILVCILNDVGDAVYHVNNVITCGIGESVDYQYEPILDEVE